MPQDRLEGAPVLAFVHIPKTAGVTLNQILRNSFGLEHQEVDAWDKNHDFYSADDHRRLRRIIRGPLRSLSSHWLKPYADLHEVIPNLHFWTFFRDPVARSASHYQYHEQIMGQGRSFEEFEAIERFHNVQTRFIAGKDDVELAKRVLRERFFFIGLQERFDESLLLLRMRAAPEVKLRIHYRARNVAPDSSIREGLLADENKVERLKAMNPLDLELYDFVVDELYAQQVAEYGPTLEEDLERFRLENLRASYGLSYYLNFTRTNLVYKPYLRLSRWMGPVGQRGVSG